jgi:PleD family two-component response regulator
MEQNRSITGGSLLEMKDDQHEKATSILIVDDHPMVREGLAGLLERHKFRVVGLAANGHQAL